MKSILRFEFVAVLLLMMSVCNAQKAPQVEGHYTYEHAFNYDMEGNHFDVSETGTMDFYADSTALDSARQVYHVTLADGDTVMWVYNYISPSLWRVEGDALFFAGIKNGFRTLWADYFPDNPASGKVMEHCGFRDTGLVNRCSRLQLGSDRPVKIMKLEKR